MLWGVRADSLSHGGRLAGPGKRGFGLSASGRETLPFGPSQLTR